MRISSRFLVGILLAAIFAASPAYPQESNSSAALATAATTTTAPQGTIARTIPIAPAIPIPGNDAGSAIFKLPLNKTRGIDIDGKVRDIVIGNSTIADVLVRSPNQVYLMGRAIGSTNVFFMGETGTVLRQMEVQVAPDEESIRDALRTMFPDENISASSVGDSIVLSGSVSSDGIAAQIRQLARRFVPNDENIVNMMIVGNEQQVLLRVRISELSKSAIKDMSAAYTLLDPVNIGGAALSFLGGFGAVGGGILRIVNPNDYTATFSWLETQGLAKTLAEPNLLTVSGESASFLAGGEFPIPINQDNGSTTVEFRTFGVSLSFVPVVLGTGTISLKLQTEVSQIDTGTAVSLNAGNGSFVVPGLSTRRAQSTIELPSGGSIMIAGLLQNDIVQTMEGIPGLMNVPILGTLFRSPHFQRQETELVVTVSAYLAKAVTPSELALPTDGFAPSHDLDRYFIGHLQNIYIQKPPASGRNQPNIQGPIGYIID